MLRYLARCGKTLLQAYGKPTVKISEESVVVQRVRIADIDYNLHMNNSRYLEALEMGRFDQIVRSGLLSLMINERVMPVVAGIDIRYLHQLKYGQQYVVHSRVSGWNEKWFYISQSISTKDTGKLAVTSMVRAAFLQKGKVLNPYDLMVRLGYEDSGSQKMPDYVAKYDEAETSLHRHLKQYTHKDVVVANHGK